MRALLLLALLSIPAAAEEPRAALGFTVLGVQASWDVTPVWRGEFRWLTGKENSDYGQVTANVFSARAYRFFHESNATRPYWGAEAGYVSASPAQSKFQVTGLTAGAFLGVERRFSTRLRAGLDLGPYVFALQEHSTDQSSQSLDFILNFYFLVYLF